MGNIGPGMLSDWFARRGVSAPVAPAIAVTCLAAFLCQCWSTNEATLAGGAMFAQVPAVVIMKFGYPSAFALAAVLHAAAVVIMFLIPRPHRMTGKAMIAEQA